MKWTLVAPWLLKVSSLLSLKSCFLKDITWRKQLFKIGGLFKTLEDAQTTECLIRILLLHSNSKLSQKCKWDWGCCKRLLLMDKRLSKTMRNSHLELTLKFSGWMSNNGPFLKVVYHWANWQAQQWPPTKANIPTTYQGSWLMWSNVLQVFILSFLLHLILNNWDSLSSQSILIFE